MKIVKDVRSIPKRILLLFLIGGERRFDDNVTVEDLTNIEADTKIIKWEVI